MFDPVTFVLAAVLCFSVSIYQRSKRRRARLREFDGGFAFENERHVTHIKSRYVISHGDKFE